VLRFLATIAAILWIVLGMMAIVSFAPTQENHQQNSAEEHKASKCEEEGPPSLIRTVFCWTGNFIDANHDDISAVSTVIIAIFTIILVFATSFLYSATRALVREAEDTAERQLRAYVFVCKSSREGAPSPSPEFRIVIKNFGQTPARKGTYWVSSRIAEYSSVTEFDRPNDAGSGRFELAPSDVSTVTGINVEPNKLRIEGESLAAFRGNKIAFFVFGEINYTDAFSKIRTTKFRLRYIAESERYGVLSNAEEGNEST
jgi:hypothetical protein